MIDCSQQGLTHDAVSDSDIICKAGDPLALDSYSESELRQETDLSVSEFDFKATESDVKRIRSECVRFQY